MFPHDGTNNNATWEYINDNDKLILNGVGAHVGIPKAANGEVISSNERALEISLREYIVRFNTNDEVIFDINSGSQGNPSWWSFIYVRSQEPDQSVLQNTGLSEELIREVAGIRVINEILTDITLENNINSEKLITILDELIEILKKSPIEAVECIFKKQVLIEINNMDEGEEDDEEEDEEEENIVNQIKSYLLSNNELGAVYFGVGVLLLAYAGLSFEEVMTKIGNVEIYGSTIIKIFLAYLEIPNDSVISNILFNLPEESAITNLIDLINLILSSLPRPVNENDKSIIVTIAKELIEGNGDDNVLIAIGIAVVVKLLLSYSNISSLEDAVQKVKEAIGEVNTNPDLELQIPNEFNDILEKILTGLSKVLNVDNHIFSQDDLKNIINQLYKYAPPEFSYYGSTGSSTDFPNIGQTLTSPFTGKDVCQYRHAYFVHQLVNIGYSENAVVGLPGENSLGFMLYTWVVLTKTSCTDLTTNKLKTLIADKLAVGIVYVSNSAVYMIDNSQEEQNKIIKRTMGNAKADFIQCNVSFEVEPYPNVTLPFEDNRVKFNFSEMVGFNTVKITNNNIPTAGRTLGNDINTLSGLWQILRNFYGKSSCNELYTDFNSQLNIYIGKYPDLTGVFLQSLTYVLSDNNTYVPTLSTIKYDCPCIGEKIITGIEPDMYVLTTPCQNMTLSFRATTLEFPPLKFNSNDLILTHLEIIAKYLVDQKYKNLTNKNFQIYSDVSTYLNDCPICYNCINIINKEDCLKIYSNSIPADVTVVGIKQICRNVNNLQLELVIKRPTKDVCQFLNVQSIEGCVTVDSYNNGDLKQPKEIAKGNFGNNCQVKFYRCLPYSSNTALSYNTPSSYQIKNNKLVINGNSNSVENYYNLNEILTKFINKIDCEEELKLIMEVPISIHYNVCDCVCNLCDILSPDKCNLDISLRLKLNVWQQPNVIADAIILDKDFSSSIC